MAGTEMAKNKSNFCPPRNRNITLDNYIDFLTKYPLEELLSKDTIRSNLTREEQNALKELKDDSEIIIFEADKGGAVVVMDRAYYAIKCSKCWTTQKPTMKSRVTQTKQL